MTESFLSGCNIRDRDTLEQMAIISRAMVGRRLNYADLIA